ncbi:MAG TPA: Hpt domain-containing protein [Vicinamibacteria bacterium]|nr:Hpt domain-containing protein [Vicinamibacteria bacterium]
MPEGEDSEAPLDRSVVDTLLALGADLPGFDDELTGDFVSAVARHTGAMRDAVRSARGEDLGFAAHALRGSCGILGARRMARLCDEIETAAAAGAFADAGTRIDSLEREYPEVKRALDEAIRAARARRA